MNRTKIEWVKNPDNITQGITVNSKTGCLNHVNGLCKGGNFPCYAYRLANGRLRERYRKNWNFGGVTAELTKRQTDPFYPRFWPERLEQIRKIKKPTGIFLDDMSDWMGDYWPKEWTEAELQVMRDCPQHRFYTLTKQPQNLIKFLGGNITNTAKGYRRPNPLPENVWAGVTVINKAAAYGARDFLNEVQATVKFLSLEPLLGRMDSWALGNVIRLANWLIIGAMTCGGADLAKLSYQHPELTPIPYGNRYTLQPPIECVEEIVEACKRADIPYFLKDNLRPLLGEFLPQELPK